MIFPIVGNSSVCSSAENIINENRIPHAILIDGDIGTGRHTLAKILSRACVCTGSIPLCDTCNNCHLSERNCHPDISVIAPEEGKKNITVGQIRELKANAYVKPNMANKKVFIIDFADTLNEQAQNALLKVLEEPPESTVFILICESKAGLLDTVISRCITFSLNVPTFDEAYKYLLDLNKYSAQDIMDFLESSRNNIGKALMLLDGKEDTKTSAAAKEYLSFALKGNQWEMLKISVSFEKSRVEASAFLRDLKLNITEEIKKNPKGVRSSALLKFFDEVTAAEKKLITNINLPLLFSDLTAKGKKYIK